MKYVNANELLKECTTCALISDDGKVHGYFTGVRKSVIENFPGVEIEDESRLIDYRAIFEKLTHAFPHGIINSAGEFIAHHSGDGFILFGCKSELEVKCKVLEWLSRAAFKSEPFRYDTQNRNFHIVMCNGINDYLGTNFRAEDMETIYTYLGNAIRHDRTIEFITKANYSMSYFDQFR